jgi:hypothetical protein
MCCDVDPDEASAVEPDDDEGIKQVETDSWNNEQVHGGNVRRVVTQEGPPSLAGWPRRLTMYLATLDCATSNPSLSSSPWMRGAPQRLPGMRHHFHSCLVIALDRAGTDRRADRHDQTVIGESRTAAKPLGLGRRIDCRREA